MFMIESIDHQSFNGRFKLVQHHDLALIRVNFFGNRNINNVVVPVTFGVIALTKLRQIFLGRKLFTMQTVGGRKFKLLTNTHNVFRHLRFQ